jgi:hypothetical protein
VVFRQLYGKYQGATRKDGARPALFPGKAAKFYCDYFIVHVKHDNSDFESQKALQPKLCPLLRPDAS